MTNSAMLKMKLSACIYETMYLGAGCSSFWTSSIHFKRRLTIIKLTPCNPYLPYQNTTPSIYNKGLT
jgi:hypothetical protein